jgi:hypothetical protein
MGAAALALAASMAASPAHAISGSMSWDPRYGSPFLGSDNSSTADDMFWSGNATYFIPDACAAQLVAGATVTCAGMEVQAIQVKLSAGDLGGGGTLVDTLDFSFQALSITTLKLNGSGNVAWILTGLFDEFVDGNSTAFALNTFGFTISFDSNGATLYHASTEAVEKHKNGHEDADHFWKGVGKGHFSEACGSTPDDVDFSFNTSLCGFSSEVATVTFAPIASIPEPQTYALMLVGLAAMGFVTRRRRQG